MNTASPEPIRCRLNDRGLIRVAGAGARTFLQGQLSNDVNRLSATQSQLSALNTPQGRTLALLRLLQYEDAIYLSLPAALAASTADQLRRYVLRARVEVDVVDDGPGSIGIAGNDAALAAAGFSPPAAIDGADTHDGTVAIRVHAHAGSRFELFGAPQRLAEIAEKYHPADAAEWRLLDTLAGIPLLSPATSGEFVAQMLNLDRLNAVSFNKGCYTGQEVIARAHYRGQVKRRLRLAFADGEVAPGTTAHTAGHGGAGTVIQSAPDPVNGFALLIVAPTQWNDGDTIRFDGPDKVEARLAALAPQ